MLNRARASQLLPSAFAATCVACLVCLCSQDVPGGPLNGIYVASCHTIHGESSTGGRLTWEVGMEGSGRTINGGLLFPYHLKSMRAIALVATDVKMESLNTPVNRVGV